MNDLKKIIEEQKEELSEFEKKIDSDEFDAGYEFKKNK